MSIGSEVFDRMFLAGFSQCCGHSIEHHANFASRRGVATLSGGCHIGC